MKHAARCRRRCRLPASPLPLPFPPHMADTDRLTVLTAGEALREAAPGTGEGEALPRAAGISSSLPLPPPLPAPTNAAAATPPCCCASFFCSKYLRFTSFISRCSRSISYLYSCTW